MQPFDLAESVSSNRTFGQQRRRQEFQPNVRVVRDTSIDDANGDKIQVFSLQGSPQMRDPHVEILEYDVQTTWSFGNPPALQWQGPAFELTLDKALLRVEMRSHFATIEEARSAVELFLQSWEIDVGLTSGSREMTFVFRNARVVDRNPPPPGPIATGTVTTSGRASVSEIGRASG